MADLNIFCIVDGEPASNAFSVRIAPTGTIYDFKKIIRDGKTPEFNDIAADKLILWHVSVPMPEDDDELPISLNTLNGGKKLSPTTTLSKAFPKGIPEETINILVQRPPSDVIKSVNDVIDKVALKYVLKLHPTVADNVMPLKDRDFTPAVGFITNNVTHRIAGSTSKSDFHMVVSGGAPGIGKTRFGKELFNHLKDKWVPPSPWTKSNMHFEYLHMDFGGSIQLNDFDKGITDSSIVIGLRIAYCFFVAREYQQSFETFQFLVKDYFDLFAIGNVFEAISKHFILQHNQQPFLFLHIDEFQLIDRWDGNKDLFSKTINTLATFIHDPATPVFVQTFLSGTAPQAIIAVKESSRISFGFVSTPLLSFKSTVEIARYYSQKFDAGKFDADTYKWMLCRGFLQLLGDTGGLPRALELLFEKCFQVDDGKTFLDGIYKQDFNNIFSRTKEALESQYNIYATVNKNKKVALALLHRSIAGIPVERETLMDPNDKDSTIALLERDAHFILDACDTTGTRFIIKMPLFFVSLYNDVLHVVDLPLQEALRVRNDMHWQDWELFVAYFEAFRNNLLIELGHQTSTLSELYPGAFGTQKTLDLNVKLATLSVCQSKERFPSPALTDKTTGKAIVWNDGKNVIVNGTSAAWGDAFVVRETTQGKSIINIHQDKYDYNSAEFTTDNLSKEHKKNLDGSDSDKIDQTLRQTLVPYQHITTIFTTQPFNDKVGQDDCLVISSNNFKNYFGPVFASHANFALTEINPNFSELARMSQYIPGVGDITANEIIENRPFKSRKDFFDKVPKARKGIEKYEKEHYGKKVHLDFYPFE